MEDEIIGAKELRATLSSIVRRVRRGERFLVLHRSKPAFRIVPVHEGGRDTDLGPLDKDPMYRAPALDRSEHPGVADDHDEILYGSVPE